MPKERKDEIKIIEAQNQSYEVMEFTQMMSDNQQIRGDVNQAADMVRNMFSEKYLSPITKAIATENQKARKNPCKEARLLEALKPFIDHNNHAGINAAVDALYMIETLRGLRSGLPAQFAPAAGKTVVSQSTNQNPGGRGRGWGRNVGNRNASQNINENSNRDTSIQDDGVYDIDQTCIRQREFTPNNLAPMLLALTMMRK